MFKIQIILLGLNRGFCCQFNFLGFLHANYFLEIMELNFIFPECAILYKNETTYTQSFSHTSYKG